MLILADINDKLQVVTGQAADIDVYASFMDLASGSVTPGKQLTAITTATTTDVVAAPGASTVRNVRRVSICNKDTADSCDVTVVLDDNGTDYVINPKVTLAPGEALQYEEGVGWFVIPLSTSQRLRTMKLGSDQSNSTTTPTEVTGLSLTTGIGTFIFQYNLVLQSAASTTGHKLSVNHSGTVTSFVAFLRWGGGTTAADDVPDQDFVAAGAQVMSNFAARAKSTAGWGATTDVDTANADVLYIVEGLMVVTVDGDIELWHGSEAAAASTVKAGSSLLLVKTD